MTYINIDQIKTDGGTQSRQTIDEQVVQEYAEAMLRVAPEARKDVFPPIDVFYDGEVYWLADGFHRVAAGKRVGMPAITATVHQGTQREAVLFSVGANAVHGIRRTNADKERAVTRLLGDAEWAKWSNREIARRTNTSDVFVGKLRDRLTPPPSANISSLAEAVAGQPQGAAPTMRTFERGGKTFEMNMAGIGAKVQPPKPAIKLDEPELDEDEDEPEEEPEWLKAEEEEEVAPPSPPMPRPMPSPAAKSVSPSRTAKPEAGAPPPPPKAAGGAKVSFMLTVMIKEGANSLMTLYQTNPEQGELGHYTVEYRDLADGIVSILQMIPAEVQVRLRGE